MATPQTQRTFPEVLQDIAANLQEIIRSEFRLAKTDIKEGAAKASRPAVMLLVGLALGLYGMGFLFLAAVYGLSMIMAGWLAALLIGGLLAIVSAALVTSSGNKLKQVTSALDKTVSSLEEN